MASYRLYMMCPQIGHLDAGVSSLEAQLQAERLSSTTASEQLLPHPIRLGPLNQPQCHLHPSRQLPCPHRPVTRLETLAVELYPSARPRVGDWSSSLRGSLLGRRSITNS